MGGFQDVMAVVKAIKGWWAYRQVDWEKAPLVQINELTVLPPRDPFVISLKARVEDPGLRNEDLLHVGLTPAEAIMTISVPCRVRFGSMGETREVKFLLTRQVHVPFRVIINGVDDDERRLFGPSRQAPPGSRPK